MNIASGEAGGGGGGGGERPSMLPAGLNCVCMFKMELKLDYI